MKQSACKKWMAVFTDPNSGMRRRLTPDNGKKLIWGLFRFALLCGLSFMILFPFLVKLSSAFMSIEDTYDNTVAFIPRHPTLANIWYILDKTPFWEAVIYTFLLSLMVAVCSTIMAALVGYGLAKFKFRGSGIVMALVLFALLVPPQTVLIPMYTRFRYFLGGAVRLTDTPFPLLFLSLTGFGFRGGLYILIMRQVYRGIPQELSEAAAVDGMGTFRTFLTIMLPLAKPMLTVIALFSFSWQWTDTFYASTLYSKIKLLPNVVAILNSVNITDLGTGAYTRDILVNTMAILSVLPLLILFLFVQKKFVQGIERSGIVG